MSSITAKKISSSLIQMCMAIFDSSSNNEMYTSVDLLDRAELDESILVAEKKLVVNICKTLTDYIYDSNGLNIIQKSESCYRLYLFDSCIKFTIKYLRSRYHDISFWPGQTELDSMTTQLKQKGIDDRRFKCNADGIVKANDFSASEILLTEVTSGFNSNKSSSATFISVSVFTRSNPTSRLNRSIDSALQYSLDPSLLLVVMIRLAPLSSLIKPWVTPTLLVITVNMHG